MGVDFTLGVVYFGPWAAGLVRPMESDIAEKSFKTPQV